MNEAIIAAHESMKAKLKETGTAKLDIHEIFNFYNEILFQSKLGTTVIEWSDRMTLCAG